MAAIDALTASHIKGLVAARNAGDLAAAAWHLARISAEALEEFARLATLAREVGLLINLEGATP